MGVAGLEQQAETPEKTADAEKGDADSDAKARDSDLTDSKLAELAQALARLSPAQRAALLQAGGVQTR